ncbi:hypothetical protein ACEPAI_1492 [Sanghuangporus weigelae]
MYAATAPAPTYTHVTSYTSTPQPGAPAYGVINQPQVKQEEPWVSLLIQEMRALREATEKSNRRPQHTIPGAPAPQRQVRINGRCAVCASAAHSTRDCPTKISLIQSGVMLADAKGYLYPRNGRLPQGDPGMSVLDRINKLFMENPNYAPVGVPLPIQPVSDTPPRIAPPRQENMYQGHLPLQESMYQTNIRQPPPAQPNNPHSGAPTQIQESNYFEAITTDDPSDDDACEGVALLFEQEDAPEEPQESLAAAGKRPGPREVFDGIEIVTRRGPPEPKHKVRDNNKKGKPPGQRPPPPPPIEAPQEDSAGDQRLQYRATIPAYDDAAVSNVFGKILDSEVTLPIRSLLAASPEIRRKCKEFVTGRRELIRESPDHGMAMYASIPRPTSPGPYGDEEISVAPPNIPLCEIEVWLDDKIEVKALLDSGSTFVAMPKDIWKDLGSPTVMSQAITVETADRQISRSAGLIPRVRLTIGSFSIVLQVQVVEKAPFQLLLGRPFFVHTRAQVIDESDDDQTLYLTHPDTNETMSIPTIRRAAGNEKQRPHHQ